VNHPVVGDASEAFRMINLSSMESTSRVKIAPYTSFFPNKWVWPPLRFINASCTSSYGPGTATGTDHPRAIIMHTPPSISETQVTFLHFCDFHIGRKHGANREILTSAVERVETLLNENSPNVDIVILTGDIANSGAAKEYESFTNFFLDPLRKLPGLVNAQFFVVPGNHDVDCDEVLPISWDGIKDRQSIFFSEDEDGRRLRKSRSPGFVHFSDFCVRNGLLGTRPANQVSAFHRLASQTFDIITTNTAFFSDRTEDSSKPETPVPLTSLREALASASKDRLVLIVGHHSPSSFRPEQLIQLETMLREKKAVYFHGHQHIAEATFHATGTLKTLGFGATYIAPLTSSGDPIYKNTFALCTISDKLGIRAFSWESVPGAWIETTSIQFANCEELRTPTTTLRVANLPLLSDANTSTHNRETLSQIPRTQAKPSLLIPIDAPNREAWFHIFMASETIRAIYQKGDPQVHTVGEETDKAQFIFECGGLRNLVICIGGISHILSTKEIEGFNTRLDTEDYDSVTVLSLGKITDDAHEMYVRLRQRKPIEVLVNRDLTSQASEILSREQRSEINKLDSASNTVKILISEKEVFALVLSSTSTTQFFYIIDRSGESLDAANSLVAGLRSGNPEFSKMKYRGGDEVASGEPGVSFDEALYLLACHKEYNVIKYAALATVGLRFSDLPLEDLYVDATASEYEGAIPHRLEDVVGDHLAKFPVSDSLKAHIKRQLLTSVGSTTGKETSNARSFCQKYGAVLIIGDPGSGKTCFVKNEILAYCSRPSPVEFPIQAEVINWYSNHVPIMLPLSEVVAEKDHEEKGLYAIASRILARRGLSFPEIAIENLSKVGRLSWFFDGLDEVVSIERRASIVQQINELVSKTLNMGNRVIVTSRPAAIQVVNLLPTLRKLEIQGLSESEMRTLAERVLRLKLVTSSEGVLIEEGGVQRSHTLLINQLLSDCHTSPGVGRLAQNPLLLTLLIMIYANSGAPSAKRHLIYAQAIQTLASVRGREAGHYPISAQDLRERLGAVAISVYTKDSGLLPSRLEVCEIVRAVMARQRREEVGIAEASAFIQRVAESTGLIAVEQRVGESDENAVITFMHNSFLEYFAAVGLSNDLDNYDIGKLVNQPRWHEILTLLAGIIGENSDIAPVLEKFIDARDPITDVDAKLLTFAMDCALECEVPSEAAQRLLAKALRKSIESGPAKLDPWVRSELGRRTSSLIQVCGEGIIDSTLAELICSQDAEISAAGIMLSGYACSNSVESPAILAAIEQSSTRMEEIVLCSICDAATNSSSLRSETSLQVIARCLKKTDRTKRAAFDAIGAIPSLASGYWDDVVENIDSDDSTLARSAGFAAMRAGFNADVASLASDKKDLLLKVLKRGDEFDRVYNQTPSEVQIETIDRMWNSARSQDRILAIQLLPASTASEQIVYERLMGILRDGVDREEIAATLTALIDGKATALFKQSDLKIVARWLETGTLDVRIVALRLLSRFGNDTIAVEAILSRDFRKMTVEEYSAATYSLGATKVLVEVAAKRLFSELEYFLHENRSLHGFDAQNIISLFSALRKRDKTAPPNLVTETKLLFADFKTVPDVKKAALLCLPAICEPTPESIAFFVNLFSSPPKGMEASLVEVPSILAQKCRQSVDAVVACVGALSTLRETVLGLYSRVSQRRSSDEVAFAVTQLRSGVDELTQIIVAFEEFIGDTNDRDQKSLSSHAVGTGLESLL